MTSPPPPKHSSTTMTNFAKLNQEMGFQRSSTSDKQKVQPISTKVIKNDENSGDLSLVSIASNLHDISTIVNAPIPSSDLAYSSRVVEHPYCCLSPIVDDPDRAFLSNEMRAAVREVAKYFPTAIISGRSRDKVKGFVQLSNVYYACSHGMDIMVPPKPLKPCDSKYYTTISALDKKGSDALFQPAKRFLPVIQGISILLEEIARKIEGCKSRGQQILHLCTLL